MAPWGARTDQPVPLGASRFKRMMANTSPGQFLKQVRLEVAKVTWPSRRETTISTAMVFVMVVIAAVFFMLVDQVFAWGVKTIFGLGG